MFDIIKKILSDKLNKKVLDKSEIFILEQLENIIYDNLKDKSINKVNNFLSPQIIFNLPIIEIENIYNNCNNTIYNFDIPFNSFLNLLSNKYNVNAYPWKEQIKGYYYWQGKFVGSSPTTQYYFNSVSAPQLSYQEPNNLTSTEGQFNYYGDNLPDGLNTIVLFTGYSIATDVLNNLTNYTTQTNMYSNAMNYFKSNNIENFLISLCFGGGLSQTGGWYTGINGAIYSIYEACTKKGVSFSYQETDTGNTLNGVGTGLLDYSYNSFTFDIETGNSSGMDFLNLFNYIKNNINSTFYSYEIVIIVSIAHSCSNYDGTGQKVISTILTDKTKSYDFISPQLYTQNVGTMVEYCANYNILWTDTGSNDSFVYYLKQNENYANFGTSMILPSLFNNNLLITGGTNDAQSPNLYFYQSNSTSSNPPVATASGWKQIDYQVDKGATSFFNTLFETSNELGGSIQWNNGDLL